MCIRDRVKAAEAEAQAQAQEAENAAVTATASLKTSSSSAPGPTMTLTQPTSSSIVRDHLRTHRDSRPEGVPPPPTRLVPSVASALTGPPPRRVQFATPMAST
eukprot:10096439-Karenia_brevis.AAC.1